MIIILPRTTKEQAVKLKELKFDQPTDAYYYNSEIDGVTKNGQQCNFNYYADKISAPLIAFVFMWIRKAKLFVPDLPTYDGESYMCPYTHESFASYEECESAVLDYALDYLIEKKR